MARSKTTTRRKTARKPATTRPAAATRLAATWDDTRRALRAAETLVGERVATLVERSGIDTRALGKRADAWRSRLDREGRKAGKRVAARLVELQQRAARERRVVVRAADDAVARALAALNIPTRQEVQQLSRRVEQLSSRIDTLRR